jgi:hypothetical protein
MEAVPVGNEGQTVKRVPTRTGEAFAEPDGCALEDVIVSGHQASPSVDGAPAEALSLNLVKIEHGCTGSNGAGRDASKVKLGCDIGQAKTM